MSYLGKRKRNMLGGYTVKIKRPIDKQLFYMKGTGLDSTQDDRDFFTVTYPCTITGIRWEFNFVQDAGTGIAEGAWVLTINRESGNNPNTISLTNQTTMYAPEQDVLAWGTWAIDNNTQTVTTSGTTKTMRKLMTGDVIWVSLKGVDTNTTQYTGALQFFLKG